MNTTDKNILIAEFVLDKVTCVRNENGKHYNFSLTDDFPLILEQEIQVESNNGWGLVNQDYVFSEDLIFHKDYNWLMKVVEKIERLNTNVNGSFVLESIGLNAKFILDDGTRILEDSRGETKIEAIYNAIIDFIKWYNSLEK